MNKLNIHTVTDVDKMEFDSIVFLLDNGYLFDDGDLINIKKMFDETPNRTINLGDLKFEMINYSKYSKEIEGIILNYNKNHSLKLISVVIKLVNDLCIDGINYPDLNNKFDTLHLFRKEGGQIKGFLEDIYNDETLEEYEKQIRLELLVALIYMKLPHEKKMREFLTNYFVFLKKGNENKKEK